MDDLNEIIDVFVRTTSTIEMQKLFEELLLTLMKE